MPVTSAALNSCTQDTACFVDQYHVKWWDTPGFERWETAEAQAFLTDKFYSRGILPKAAIICRTANSLGDLTTIQFFVAEMKSHGILVIYCITKYKPDTESQALLLDLYKDNTGFWGRLGYGILDGFALLGWEESVSNMALTGEENAVYQALRGGHEIKNNQIEVARAVIDQITGRS